MTSPAKLAHVVFQTGRLTEMIDWYVRVLDGRVAFVTDMLGFVAYDDEHHRVAFAAPGNVTEPPTETQSGLHHVAFTYETIDGLLSTYQRLKADGLTPFWCLNHGPTTSMYYTDPDGNRVELQIDNLDPEAADAYFRSDAFAANPIGVAFDPEDLVRRHESGVPFAELVKI